MAKVLLVDDDELVRYALSKLLRKAGHQVSATDKSTKVAGMIVDDRPDLLITDIVMPDQDGIGLIREIRRTNRDLPILAISGGGRLRGAFYLELADGLGANAILEKPFDDDVFLSTIDRLTSSRPE